jgi:DNA polymerase (family 10)
MLGKRPGVELDFDRVLAKAVETQTLIEINSALARLDASSDVLFRARDLPVLFVVNTDTHHVSELSRMEWGALQATRGWVDPSRIVNTWPKNKFEKWLSERRSRRAS